jgi:hypothetical protein
MKRNRCILMLVLAAVAGCKSTTQVNSGGCKMTVQAITDSGKSDQDRSAIRLVSITPAAGSVLLQDAVLAADLEYWVQDFEPGRYTILAQFALQEPRRTTDGDFPRSEYPILTSPAGRVHFCFPVAYVWKRPVAIPFDVFFLLNKWVGDAGKSSGVAHTEHLQYSASK